MKPQLQRTFSPKPGDVERSWYVVDATDVPLGRLASEVAQVLRGKNKPTYAPHIDGGDHVIVVNAEKVHVSGSKELEKIYYRHSGYPGGLRALTLSEIRETHPERIIEIAVKGMLPKNRLGRQMYTKLKVYAGPDHPHAAQKPEPLALKYRKVEA
jgi:large subunit ribosomal protein L13